MYSDTITTPTGQHQMFCRTVRYTLARPQATAIFSIMDGTLGVGQPFTGWPSAKQDSLSDARLSALTIVNGGSMTYYGPTQLADSFRMVRKNTIAIAEEIPNEKYNYKATPEVMSVAEMLAHLAVTPAWLIEVHSRKVAQIDFEMFAAHRLRAESEQKALREKPEIL